MAKKRRKPRPRQPRSSSAAGTTTAERSGTTSGERAAPPAGRSASASAVSANQASRQRAERKELARAEREAARKRFARQARMRRLLWAGGIGVLIAAGVLYFTRDTTTTRPDQLPGELRTEAPWSANAAQVQARSDAIGLPPESPVQLHEHTNLQIFVHGEPVSIPTDIGIDSSSSPPFVASLHTHEDSGTIHIESSSTSHTFTLGEFFDIWGVRLTASCMGAYCNDGTNTLQVFVEGQQPPAEIGPREVGLSDQQVVVITYGTADELPNPIPTDFDFASVPQ